MGIIATGYLQIVVQNKDTLECLQSVLIRIYQKENEELVFEDFFMTNTFGKTEYIPLFVPSQEISLQEDSPLLPYGQYHLEIRKQGYQTQEILGIQIYADTYSYVSISMIPTPTDDSSKKTNELSCHPLWKGCTLPNLTGNLTLKTIPQDVTIRFDSPHDGDYAISLSFLEYVNHRSSSYVYPTWPKEALKAILLIEMTCIYERMQTSKKQQNVVVSGDQLDRSIMDFRTLYDRLNQAAEEVFGYYISVDTVKYHQDMNPWLILKFAEEGYSTQEILKKCYGSNTKVIACPFYQEPHYPIAARSSHKTISILQTYLNQISRHYPFIPVITDNSGYYGFSTIAAVNAFQRTLHLRESSEVKRLVYHEITRIYHQVTSKTVEKKPPQLKISDIQLFLNEISHHYKEVPALVQDGIYGEQTQHSLIAFQRMLGIDSDECIDDITCRLLYQIYKELTA